MRFTALLTAIIVASTAFSPFAVYAQTELSPATAAPQEWPAASPQIPASISPVVIDSTGGGAIPSLPLESKTSSGVTYLNGGIGDEEMAQLKSQSGSYNLHVMLSAPSGEYISDVQLQIIDSKGLPLLTVSDAGPYVYAQLKPGHYTLETSMVGNSAVKKLKINIPAKGVVKEHIVYNQ